MAELGSQCLRVLWLSHGSIARSETFLRATIEDLASVVQVRAVHGGSELSADDRAVGVIPAGFCASSFNPLLFLSKTVIDRGDWFPGIQRRCLKRIPRLIGGFSPDAVWVDYATTAVFAKGFLRRLGVPYVVHVHGYDITTSMNSAAYRSHFAESVADGAARVLCASHHMARLCVLAGVPEAKVRVLRLGIDNSRIRRDPRVMKTPHPSFVHLGRLVPQKGPLVTLEAFSRVAHRYPAASMSFIGDGVLRGELETRIADRGLSGKVRLLGAMRHEEAIQAIQSQWVFCQHSVTGSDGGQEGFAISPAEAACVELPVVSTWHDGIPEHVLDGETGFLVREFDYQSMAERMCELADDQGLRERMGQAGRQNITKMCDPALRRAEIRNIMEGLFERRGFSIAGR
jgi:colanic acid/amylovoran biosynthesis glycosyltransferase